MKNKCSIQNHYLNDKNKIFNIFNFMIKYVATFILILCSEHIFIGSLPNSLHAFTFAPSCPFFTQLPHNIHIIVRNHKHVQFLIYEIKNGLGGKEKRLNTMSSIETTPSWLLPHAKCKGMFPYSPFALTFAPL